MATPAWPKEPKVIGSMVKRLDGPLKASGRAKYAYDMNRPNLLHAVFLPSAHAHATLKSVDVSAAEKVPGVKGIHRLKKDGEELTYAGDPILAIAAETEVQAYDGLRAVKVEYEVLPHAVKESASMAEGAPKVTVGGDNVISGRAADKGNADEALGKAAVTIDRTYSVPFIDHCCLEAHGLVAEWDGNNLTVWASTQATQGVAGDLAKEFKVDVTNVRCITHVMGGGFGSKFNAGNEGLVAAHLAKLTGRPVKLMLDRKQEHSAGIRPSASARVQAGCDTDGKLIAFKAELQGSPGLGNSANFPLPYVYEDIPNVSTAMKSVRTNIHVTRAYRAPGHPQGCYVMESVMDDLAARLGKDPVDMRLANLPGGLVGDIYRKELAIATEMFGWKKKYHPPGEGSKGPIKTGVGMGCHKWGGTGVPREQMLVEINADGSVLVQSSTQDLGTGNRTVLAIVAAEVLGLKPDQINAQIGESQWARSHGSGGSTTCPSTGPVTLIAATKARDELFSKLAPVFEAKPEDLACADGMIMVKGGGKSMPWKEAVRKLGMDKVSALGTWAPGLSNAGVGGCQFAEVQVDSETGFVRVKEIVAVQDCGLIINKLACESQVAGGVIMGVNAALFEERVMDQATGHMLNPDMEFYKLGTITDMPRIRVHMFDDPISQSRGVIGIGEPPTISTMAAIGNAVFNALGVRVPDAPLTPRNVLAALARSKGGVA